jgi:hypothetical protein
MVLYNFLTVSLAEVNMSIGIGELHVTATYEVYAQLPGNLRNTIANAVAKYIVGKNEKNMKAIVRDMSYSDNRIYCSFVRPCQVVTATELKSAITTIENITSALLRFTDNLRKVLEVLVSFDNTSELVQIVELLRKEEELRKEHDENGY